MKNNRVQQLSLLRPSLSDISVFLGLFLIDYLNENAPSVFSTWGIRAKSRCKLFDSHYTSLLFYGKEDIRVLKDADMLAQCQL